MTNRIQSLHRHWAALLVLAWLVAACAPAAEPPAPTRAPAPTFTPTALVEPVPVAPPAEQPPAQQPAEQPPAEQPAPEQPPAEPTPAPIEAPATETPVPAAEVVINSNMNVRGGPGTNYNVVGAATQGQRYRVTGRNNDSSWWQIDFNGQPGWVFAQLVTPQNTQAVAVAANIPAPPPPPPPTATPVPPPPQEQAPPPQEQPPAPPPADNFPFTLGSTEQCEISTDTSTFFEGWVRRSDNSEENGVCVHIAFYGPRGVKCSGCDGVGNGKWGFAPFGNEAPPSGTTVEIFVVACPASGVPAFGQTDGFGDLTPQSPKWTYTLTSRVKCQGITFYRR